VLLLIKLCHICNRTKALCCLCQLGITLQHIQHLLCIQIIVTLHSRQIIVTLHSRNKSCILK
jgi:hypothetical protein